MWTGYKFVNRKQICEQDTNLWTWNKFASEIKASGGSQPHNLEGTLHPAWSTVPSKAHVTRFVGGCYSTLQLTIILSIRYRKGFSQICSTWFLQYSGRLGTAKGIRRIVLHGFYSIPGDKVQQKEFEELFSMVLQYSWGIRYSKRNSKNCSPWFLRHFGGLGTAKGIRRIVLHGFLQYSGWLGTAVFFLRFVPLDFSNICSTITRNLLFVPKSLGRSEIYGGQLIEISPMYLKRLTKTEIHGGHSQEIYILYLKQIHGNNFEESSCAYPNMKWLIQERLAFLLRHAGGEAPSSLRGWDPPEAFIMRNASRTS